MHCINQIAENLYRVDIGALDDILSRKPIPAKSVWYAERILSEEVPPPIILYVASPPFTLAIVDGQHRLEAHRLARKQTIAAIIAPNYREAMRLARNAPTEQTHGNRSQ